MTFLLKNKMKSVSVFLGWHLYKLQFLRLSIIIEDGKQKNSITTIHDSRGHKDSPRTSNSTIIGSLR